ncbi:hypothetical protein [Massilia solisilvae]
MLLLPILLIESANLTGFSWTRMKWVDRREIVDAAIGHVYGRVYSGLDEFRADYPNFNPEVRYWGSWSWDVENGLLEKLFGLTRYQVRLPEEIVMVDVDGTAQFTRGDSSCQSDGVCPITPPAHPQQGIVGTVQYAGPNYEPAEDFSVAWADGATGSFFKSGHCFAAYTDAPGLHPLVVTPKGAKPITFRHGYGFHVAALTTETATGTRISQAEFERSRTCNAAARKAWPNFGEWWKR